MSSASIKVFTTQAEIVFGVSFLALSPEHELLQRKELFAESVLKAVEDMRNSQSINNNEVDANNRPKKGLQCFVSIKLQCRSHGSCKY